MSDANLAKAEIIFDRIQKDIVLWDKKPVTIAAARDQNEADGLSVVLLAGGFPLVHRVWGEMRVVEGKKTTTETIYQAASTSKLVAALGIVGAHRRGEVHLNHSVASFIRKFPKSIVADWAKKKFNKKEEDYLDAITLRRLLSHTAGLDTSGIGTTDADRKGETMELILLGKLLDPVHNGVNPKRAPGIDYEYSGGGFIVAEAMLEVETGMSFADYMMRNVLVPFGMTRSTFGTATDRMSQLAWGSNHGKAKEPEVARVKAAGGLLAHPVDYANLIYMLGHDGKDREGRQVIPVEDVREVLTPEDHRDSSNRACTGACPPVMVTVVPGMPPMPVQETCINGKCKRLIDTGGSWYGQGTYLRQSLMSDGYPSEFRHGGAQEGFSAGFIFNRTRNAGIVINVNGRESFKKDGEERGAHTLRYAIEAAFRREFGI
jgi:CubicO group peptidase (beta-lactamase class C family)